VPSHGYQIADHARGPVLDSRDALHVAAGASPDTRLAVAICTGPRSPAPRRDLLYPRHAGSIAMTREPEIRVAEGLAKGPDGELRCAWGVSTPDYVDYHDREWGFPVTDDRRLFEKLCLEGFQAGLAWITILRKREAFRKAFAGFDPAAVARFGARDVTRMLGDAGIVRHRGKIESAINNAARALDVIEEHGSLSAYVWGFAPAASERPARVTHAALRALSHTPSSIALSKDLKRRGWTFIGPTTVYAFMQAMGMVDDHLEGCVIRRAAEAARKQLPPAPRAKRSDVAPAPRAQRSDLTAAARAKRSARTGP
jgi:DNA-3-methyladenine glycosylase I